MWFVNVSLQLTSVATLKNAILDFSAFCSSFYSDPSSALYLESFQSVFWLSFLPQ